jgi:hypothetical protein
MNIRGERKNIAPCGSKKDYTQSRAAHAISSFPTTNPQEPLMPIKSVNDLFVHEISDTYNAEKQMTRSLPKLARAATDPELTQAFEDHL